MFCSCLCDVWNRQKRERKRREKERQRDRETERQRENSQPSRIRSAQGNGMKNAPKHGSHFCSVFNYQCSSFSLAAKYFRLQSSTCRDFSLFSLQLFSQLNSSPSLSRNSWISFLNWTHESIKLSINWQISMRSVEQAWQFWWKLEINVGLVLAYKSYPSCETFKGLLSVVW